MEENKTYRVQRNVDIQTFPQIANCVQHFNNMFFNHLEDINVWIAGGSVRDYFQQGYTESDYDFYGPTRDELAKLVRVLRNNFQFKHYLITSNAIKGYGFFGKKKILIDVVKVVFENMEATIDYFDFTICCFSVNRSEVKFHPSAPFDLLRKRLVVNNLPFPISTLQRMQKFLKRDYWICNGGMLEIAKAIGNVDFEDPSQNSIEMYPDGTPRFVRFD